eukprot:3793868-Karenia_brevis.AAC.1
MVKESPVRQQIKTIKMDMRLIKTPSVTSKVKESKMSPTLKIPNQMLVNTIITCFLNLPRFTPKT